MWIVRKGTAFNLDNMKGITTVGTREGFVYVTKDEFETIIHLMNMNVDGEPKTRLIDLDMAMRKM